VGIASGTGANAGEAIRLAGDRFANDMTISYPRVRSRAAFKLVDRRAIMRVDAVARRRMGYRVQGRHTVLCSKPTTLFVYAGLGAGSDRLTVRGAPRSRAGAGAAGCARRARVLPGGRGQRGLVPRLAHRRRRRQRPHLGIAVLRPHHRRRRQRRHARARRRHLFEFGQRRSDSDKVVGGAGRNALAWNANTPR